MSFCININSKVKTFFFSLRNGVMFLVVIRNNALNVSMKKACDIQLQIDILRFTYYAGHSSPSWSILGTLDIAYFRVNGRTLNANRGLCVRLKC